MAKDRLSGILLHPTSLPSPFGIGDFGKCAYDFVDFLVKAKQSLWQILPLGPTSFGDSPYQSFSAFAGNHLLISPEILMEEGFLSAKDLAESPTFDEKNVDYDRVTQYKNNLFKIAFDNYTKNAVYDKEWNDFLCRNQFWLEDYSMFVSIKNAIIQKRRQGNHSNEYNFLKKKFKNILEKEMFDAYYFGGVFSLWPEELLNRDKNALSSYAANLQEEIDFVKFLQYNFFKQWSKLKKYANQNGIKIIGDLPIFVAYDSADVWAHPKNFFLDQLSLPKSVAGVPPDYFSITGQLWGNPLYDWDYHKKDGYDFWIKRMKSALQLADIVRVDHFRGFEGYYSIPFGDKTAENGCWKKGPCEDLFIEMEKALGRLSIIAEDLGIITDEVNALRERFHLPGMKVLQFAFNSGADNAYLPHNYQDTNCVVYTGTHDNDTTLGWYMSGEESEKDFFRRYLNSDGNNVCWDLIRLAYASSARWAVIPLQDILSLDGSFRMNTPSVPYGNWRFRFKKEMISEDITERLQYLVSLFGRQKL